MTDWGTAAARPPVPGSGHANQANYYLGVFSVTGVNPYSDSQNYLTDVGAFTNSASYYGTFDQSGNLYQWNDLDGASGSTRGYRGGRYGNYEAGQQRFAVTFTTDANYFCETDILG